ncbi:MAG: aminotransferase class I/II-fold pyridoxal phosphate-dependent enzyme [Mariniphaga sp.]|nr:aminotransferase class I/II-fold pyridoxal phosphate-dependent enzyme [Mariniphaga sp.]
MKIKPFELERFFAKYEFNTPYLLSCSDCEAFTLNKLLKMADDETKNLWHNLKLSYTESSGHPLLKQEIAKFHTSILPDEINVLVPEEGIFIAMNCILENGDHVISTFPGYQSLYEIANTIGCKVSGWEPVKQNNWFFDVEKLASLIRPETKLIVINFPHNPTGAIINHKQQLGIIELCREKNILLFSDEMYRFLEYNEKDRLPSASDLYENAISLFGLSKSFALPGLRIGWLVSKNKKLMDEIARFKDYTTICNNAPGEILAIIALRNRSNIFRRNLEIIKRNLAVLDSFFLKYSNYFSWNKSNAGSIAFPEFLGNIGIDEFCKRLIEKEGVMILPSSVYNYPGNHFRIGFGRKNMPEALERVEQYLNEKFYNEK